MGLNHSKTSDLIVRLDRDRKKVRFTMRKGNSMIQKAKIGSVPYYYPSLARVGIQKPDTTRSPFVGIKNAFR